MRACRRTSSRRWDGRRPRSHINNTLANSRQEQTLKLNQLTHALPPVMALMQPGRNTVERMMSALELEQETASGVTITEQQTQIMSLSASSQPQIMPMHEELEAQQLEILRECGGCGQSGRGSVAGKPR